MKNMQERENMMNWAKYLNKGLIKEQTSSAAAGPMTSSFGRRRSFCFEGQFEVVDYLVYDFIIFDKWETVKFYE